MALGMIADQRALEPLIALMNIPLIDAWAGSTMLKLYARWRAVSKASCFYYGGGKRYVGQTMGIRDDDTLFGRIGLSVVRMRKRQGHI
jgi:hypothetical protein